MLSSREAVGAGRLFASGITAGLIAFALLLGPQTPSAHAAGVQGPYGQSGKWILDDTGRTVILNGWNMVNKVSPYTAEAIGFGADDVAFLKREGFNTIRLGLIWKGVEPAPGEYDEAYLDSVERTYDLLSRNGFAVMLDFHQDMYNERFQGEGMPDWAVVGDAATLPVGTLFGFPANYFLMRPLSLAYDSFWSNAEAQDGRPLWNAYAEAWRHVAERFRGKPRLLGYNLFNEPFPGTQFLRCIETPIGCPDLDGSALTSFHRTVAREIREVDRRSIVWYAPLLTFDYGVRTGHGAIAGKTGFAFNAYCVNGVGSTGGAVAALFPYFADRSCTELADLTNDQANAQAKLHDDAVLNTEFGATEDLENISISLQSFDRKMIGWQQWAYWNRDPCCEWPDEDLVVDPSKPPTGDNVKFSKLRVSARPHPEAVAGTPTSYGFSPKRRIFKLTYSTLSASNRKRRFPAGSVTEVEIPSRQYRNGYRAAVTGARVVSNPGAQTLRLRSCHGSKAVRLSVSPGLTRASERACPKR